jgi:hypothetical protein
MSPFLPFPFYLLPPAPLPRLSFSFSLTVPGAGAGANRTPNPTIERDSLKDETIVVVFIFATAGLLGWALVKPWIDRLRERNTFMPLPQR